MVPEAEPGFLGPLRLQDIDGGRMKLTVPLAFYSARHHGVFKVRRGFVTDFASVPFGLRNVFPKSGKYNRAAVLHDAAYRGVLVNGRNERVTLIRPLADALFLEAMLSDSVNRVQARLMYWAVRVGGRWAYRGLSADEEAA